MEKRNLQLNIRVNESERALAELVCAAMRETISRMFRRLVMEEHERIAGKKRIPVNGGVKNEPT